MKILLKKTADDIYTTVVRIPEKSIYTTVLQIDNAQGWGIYTRRSCELYKGIILHDRDVWNRQYTWVGATLLIDIGSYSSRSFGDLRTIFHGI